MPINTVQVVIIALILLLLVLTLFGGVIKDIIPEFDRWVGGGKIIPLNLITNPDVDVTCEEQTLAAGAQRVGMYFYEISIGGLRVDTNDDNKNTEDVEAIPVLFFKDRAGTPVDIKWSKLSNMPNIIRYQVSSSLGPTHTNEVAAMYFFEKNEQCYDLGQGSVSSSEFISSCASNLIGSASFTINSISDCKELTELPLDCRSVGTLFGRYGCVASKYNCYWPGSCEQCPDMTGKKCDDEITLTYPMACKCIANCYAKKNGMDVDCLECTQTIKCEDFDVNYDCVRNPCNKDCYWDETNNKCVTCTTAFNCEKLIDENLCKVGACGLLCEWNNNKCAIRTSPLTNPNELIR